MLVIPVKEGEQIDRALKRLKRKFLQTGTLKRIRAKKQYLKPTEKNRVKMQKAAYSAARLREMEQNLRMKIFQKLEDQLMDPLG